MSDVLEVWRDHANDPKARDGYAHIPTSDLRVIIDRLTTAERERDEARRERDVLRLVVSRDTPLVEQSIRAIMEERDKLRHRAERMERVVEAANAIYDARNETEDWEARSRLMDALKEYCALDAAEGK